MLLITLVSGDYFRLMSLLIFLHCYFVLLVCACVISWMGVSNRAKQYTKRKPCWFTEVCHCGNKHVATVTFTKQNPCSRQNKWWCTQTLFCILCVCVCLCVWVCVSVSLSEKKALDRSYCAIAGICLFSAWTISAPPQPWATGLWWCTWRSAALWSALPDGSWSVPPCPQRSGPGLKWTALSWPPQTISPIYGRTVSPTPLECLTVRESRQCSL